MSVIKKPYEISIWEDVIVYVGVDQNGQSIESQNLSDLASVEYQYYTEQRLAIIGSNTMTSPARVINPAYKRNINGIETLTFEMYYQYEEVESGEIIRNPLINLVLDERKVKLYYENKWHDFIIKKDDEKGRDFKYSFTCTGLAANELGKTGFNIELDAELENNMGTVQELGAAILEGSDWQLAETGQETIQQVNDEALYKILLGKDISAKQLDGSSYGTISTGKCIYAYYTPFANEESNYFQFIYVDKNNGFGTPDLYEDKITINCTNVAGGTFDLYMDGIQWYNGYPDFCFKETAVTQEQFEANKTRYWYYTEENGYVQCTSDSEYDSGETYYITAVTVADYRGRRYVRKQLTTYDPTLGRTVSKYTRDNTEYYGYTTTNYIDSTTVENYIYNSSNFAGKSYWGIYGNSITKSVSTQVFPSVSSTSEAERAGYLVVNFGNSTNTKLVNDGIVQNYSRINRFDKGDKFRLKVCIGTVSGDVFTPFTDSNLPIYCKVKKYTQIDSDDNCTIYFDSTAESTVKYTDGDYVYLDMICLNSATWNDLNKNVGIFFGLNSASEINYFIKDIQLYRYVIGKNGCIIAPDDPLENLPDVRVETEYHFYDPSLNGNKFSEEDYVYSESDPSLYTPLYGSGEQEFEKVRSITAKESNRFNLLQELCETFECWVKFDVAHELNGTISIESFDYYDIISNPKAEDWANYYYYDWTKKQYVKLAEASDFDENGKYFKKVERKRQVKRVTFYKEILIDNYAGFKYGINLKDNNRTLDSEQIVTKIIVKNNSCDQAENGFCSIARAQDNPIKENFVYNFDYYTSQGLINQSHLNNDLYLEINGSIGLYPRLARLNRERNSLIDSSAPLANSISDLTSKYQVASLMYNEAEKDLQRMKDPQSGTIYQYTHYIYEDFFNQYGRAEDNQNVPSYPNEIYYINVAGLTSITPDEGELTFYKVTADDAPATGKTYYYISGGKFVQLYNTKFREGTIYYERESATYAADTYFQTGSTTSTLTFAGAGSPEVYIYNAARRRMDLGAEDYINDNFTISTLEKITTQEGNKAKAQEDMDKFGPDLEAEQEKYNAIASQLKEIANATDEVEKEFNVKYARYIQEGSWMDDNYMDDDLYYLDSLSVLYQSAYPKVTYNFNVLDLSQLEGYEAYKFDIGHKTFVEDKEFFGYHIVDNLLTPVREQVVVTESNIYLDQPDRNQLKVQNYKSHFEDLFQRITAATQNVEYHSGEYGRAANAVTSTGEISETVMQRSLATSNYIIQNSHDQSVTWDDTGIQAINLSDPAQITRLASAGLLVSNDGGLTWGVAISGAGINTNYLTAGIINADNINIMSGTSPTFKWDSAGLRAYGFEQDENGNILSYNAAKFVNYDKYGIYGINGQTKVDVSSLEDIQNKANFALTWDGLFIHSSHRDGYVTISPTEDIALYETRVPDGETEPQDYLRGKFGLLHAGDANSNDIYGLALYAEDGQTQTLTTQSDGTIWLLDSMRIGTPNQTNTIYIGVGETDLTPGANRYKVINVNDLSNEEKFVVYSDGTLKASGVNIEGYIEATSGKIGNLTIEEVLEDLSATGNVRIVIENGDTFKINDDGTVTPSSLTFSIRYSPSVTISSVKWTCNDSQVVLGTGQTFTLTYNESTSQYFTNGIAHLHLLVNETYSDEIVLYAEAKDTPYSLSLSVENFNKTVKGKENGLYTWDYSVEDIYISAVNNLTSEYIAVDNWDLDILFYNQSIEDIVNSYYQVRPSEEEFNANKTKYYYYDNGNYIQCTAASEYSIEVQYYIITSNQISHYIEDDSANRRKIFHIKNFYDDEILENNDLLQTLDSITIHFNGSITEGSSNVVIAREIISSVGTSVDMATFALNANSINAAIGSTALTFSTNGLEIANGGITVKDKNNQTVLYFDENPGNLIISGIIYASGGTFTGTVHATDGDFTGQINAGSGNIAGFNISDNVLESSGLRLISAHTENNVEVPSKIEINNAQITGALNVGNLTLSSPLNEDDKVLELKKDNQSYFSLLNNGDIEGNNWSIKTEDGTVTARFGKLIANDGEFNGTINATSGKFTGEINAGIINAATINTASFVTQKIRAMGGAFIFKPTFAINEITPQSSNIVEILLPQEAKDYFSSLELNNDTDIIVSLSGTDIRLGKIIDLTEIENLKIKVQFASSDYAVISDNTNIYNTITLFGKGDNIDSLIGINSDNSTVSNLLPARALVIEDFSDLQVTDGDVKSSYIIPSIKLLLGDLSGAGVSGLTGYGLYADNVYLNGSLTTKGSSNNTYAGINTLSNIIFDSEIWGATQAYPNEKIVFWGGASGINEAIRSAPFIVTDKGNLFAKSGEFKGTVISNSVITQSIIKTPIIYGTGEAPSLKIYDTGTDSNKTGIGFYKLVNQIDDESNENNDVLTMIINNTGFTHYQGSNFEKFIEFNENNNDIIFNATKYKSNTTSITSNEIKDELNGIAAKVNLYGGGSGYIQIDYNNYGIEITGSSITNYGGQVINKGNMQILHKGENNNPDQYLNYKYVNGYYCLYVS